MEEATRVDFYQLAADGDAARDLYACRLAEKAVRHGFRVLLLARDDAHAAALDDLLWSFSPESFVAHARASGDGNDAGTPLLVSSRDDAANCTMLINPGDRQVNGAARFRRLACIVPADPQARAPARAAYQAYQALGCSMHYHDIARAGAGKGSA